MESIHFIIPVLEILFIATLINYLLSFFWNTRAMDLVFGFIIFLLIFAAAKWLHFPVIERIMLHVVNVALIAAVVIFQPELRIALSKLSLKSRRSRDISAFDRFVESLTTCVYRLSEKRIGALIVIENQDQLDEYANKSVLLFARFSSELLESIFAPTTPLHDGAVIIRDQIILSAATILPLADDNSQLTRSMGTRHRAGLGISQLTDSLIIVISEETSKVSIAREGIMTKGIKPDRFRGIIRSVFNTPAKQTRFNFWDWLKQ